MSSFADKILEGLSDIGLDVIDIGRDLEKLEKENKQLKRINTLLEESNDFYANWDNCDTIQHHGKIFYHSDTEKVDLGLHVPIIVCGKKARETAKQIEKIRSE